MYGWEGLLLQLPRIGRANAQSSASFWDQFRSERMHSAGIFYEFTSTQTLRGSGFAVTTGIGTLACQVQGMTLD